MPEVCRWPPRKKRLVRYPKLSKTYIDKTVKEADRTLTPAHDGPNEFPMDYALKQVGKEIKKVK